MARKTETTAMSPEERKHRDWHHDHVEMDTKAHEALMRRLGVTEQEHEIWHRLHRIPMERDEEGARQVLDPNVIGAGFVEHCISRGWIIREGHGHRARYYPTEEGRAELRKFGIEL